MYSVFFFTIIGSGERERRVRKGERKEKEKAQERQRGRKEGWMCAEEVEGERKDAAKTVSVKHTGRKCLRQEQKQIQPNAETNTATSSHRRVHARRCREVQTSEGTHTQKGLHVNAGGCELRWM